MITLRIICVFLWEQIKGLTKRKASVEQIAKRYEICGPCFQFQPTDDMRGRCLACQCNVNLQRNRLNKLALKTSKCPGGLWDEID